MPHINIKMYEGKTEQEKQAICKALAEAFIATTGCPDKALSIAIEDIAPDNWAEDVFRPEILEKAEKIYKQPGYNPFKQD